MVIFALLLLLAATYIIIGKVDASNAAVIYSALTGVTGTIVGAYLGVKVGSSGKQEAVNTALLVDPNNPKEEVLKMLAQYK